MFRTFHRFNYMYQLKVNGLIENMVFSIPRSLETIKFGAWNAEENNELFKTFTSDSKYWRITAKSV